MGKGRFEIAAAGDEVDGKDGGAEFMTVSLLSGAPV